MYEFGPLGQRSKPTHTCLPQLKALWPNIIEAFDLTICYGDLVGSNPYRHSFNKPSELSTPAMSMICSR
jgi:hypothetical protein